MNSTIIPRGSVVLITGVNGFVESHVADQFLEAGYKVRGTCRDNSRNSWLQTLFDHKYAKGSFQLCTVPDISENGAYKEAARGVSAVIHVASIMTFDPDPQKVIPQTVAGAMNALEAAYAEPSVRRFVLTSSSTAAILSPNPAGTKVHAGTWNEKAVRAAGTDTTLPMQEQALLAYSAAKTRAEQMIWNFHEKNQERRPDLAVNTILPNVTFGKVLDTANQGYPSSAGFIALLWSSKDSGGINQIYPQFYVDVQDFALLHVAAAISPGVQNERIFAFAGAFNCDDILAILRRQNPDRVFVDDFQSQRDYTEVVPRARAEQILQDMGRKGWTSLEESILMNTEELRGSK
ncbi:hypothetical protein E8E14_006661 [Neopestalotiopsis sp. 37M]|nr:hypothetical protein E8E14_006661 [Neopestalotiopsis sp. 37M]